MIPSLVIRSFVALMPTNLAVIEEDTGSSSTSYTDATPLLQAKPILTV